MQNVLSPEISFIIDIVFSLGLAESDFDLFSGQNLSLIKVTSEARALRRTSVIKMCRGFFWLGRNIIENQKEIDFDSCK